MRRRRNSHHSRSSYYGPGALLVLHLVSHLILLTTLCSRCYHPHFQGEKTGVEKLNHLPKVLRALLLSLHLLTVPSNRGCCNDHVLCGRLPDLSWSPLACFLAYECADGIANSACPKCAAAPVSHCSEYFSLNFHDNPEIDVIYIYAVDRVFHISQTSELRPRGSVSGSSLHMRTQQLSTRIPQFYSSWALPVLFHCLLPILILCP